jgi:hypothetical protein
MLLLGFDAFRRGIEETLSPRGRRSNNLDIVELAEVTQQFNAMSGLDVLDEPELMELLIALVAQPSASGFGRLYKRYATEVAGRGVAAWRIESQLGKLG